MTPGRELDVLVAKKVMGLAVWPQHCCGAQGYGQGADDHCDGCDFETDKRIWQGAKYSTDIAAAWEVVEKDDGWGFDWRLKRWAASSKPWACTAERIVDGKRFYVEAVTAPHAICLAALKALE